MDYTRLQQLAGVITEGSLSPAKPGQQMGANDQAGPKDFTPKQLSEVHDFLIQSSELLGLGKEFAKRVFAAMPANLKGEYTYSNWKYTK